MSVERFRDEHFFLSNMFPIAPPDGEGIRVGGHVVPTLENIYKAVRFTEDDDQQAVLAAPNGFAAKSVADKLERGGAPVRFDLEAIKLPLMRACVALKFGQNKPLADRLVSTGDEALVEGQRGNRHSFWGVAPIGSQNGYNWLGRVLMDTRGKLNEQSDTQGLHPELLLEDSSILAVERVIATPTRYVADLLDGAR